MFWSSMPVTRAATLLTIVSGVPPESERRISDELVAKYAFVASTSSATVLGRPVASTERPWGSWPRSVGTRLPEPPKLQVP